MHPLRRLATAAVVLAATIAVLPGGATAARAPQQTRVIADCVHRTVEPRKVISACADANEYAVVKRYGSWGDQEAWGSGRLHLNDCKPTCAGGTMRSYKATFRFHRVVETRHGPLFTRLGVTYIKGGEQHDTQLSLPRRPLAAAG